MAKKWFFIRSAELIILEYGRGDIVTYTLDEIKKVHPEIFDEIMNELIIEEI